MSHDHFHPNSYLLIDLRQGTTLNYNNLQHLSLLLSLYMPLCRQSEEIKCFIQAIRTCNISASFLPLLPTFGHIASPVTATLRETAYWKDQSINVCLSVTVTAVHRLRTARTFQVHDGWPSEGRRTIHMTR
jgi:hypothetical protein